MAKEPTRDRVDSTEINTTPMRRPDWIRVRAAGGETYQNLQTLMRSKSLHTVCEEASWGQLTKRKILYAKEWKITIN